MAAIHARLLCQGLERGRDRTIRERAWLSFAPRLAAPEQTVQGFLIVRSAGDEAEILTLAVDPSHRRQGLARALLAAAIDSLRKAGAKRLFLEVDEANEPARGLYQSLGAVAVGRRPRYYEHGADADIFSLAL